MTALPAWSAAFAEGGGPAVPALPWAELRAWAFDGGTGAGVRVAVVDSGVDADHPLVGGLGGAVAFEVDADAETGWRMVEAPHEDLVGHGTACAAVIRSLAPEAEIWSVRVLGGNLRGRGALLHAGIEWAVAQGMDVVNLSLSSKSEHTFAALHQVADRAYFARTLLVAAANNQPGPTYPAEYASVLSVAAVPDAAPWDLAYNPRPPVEFGARGIDVEVAWSGGGTVTATGNSFAAPHVVGQVAVLLGKHPGLTPFQVKAVLQAVASGHDAPS